MKKYWIEILRPAPDGSKTSEWCGDVIEPTEDKKAAKHVYDVALRVLYGNRGFKDGQLPLVRIMSGKFSKDNVSEVKKET